MGMPPEVRAAFDREFDEAYLRAMAYALKHCRTLPWVAYHQAVVSVARDFLASALEATLAFDRRRWDSSRVRLPHFLCGVIQSLVAHARERVENQHLDSVARSDQLDARADPAVPRPVPPEAFYLSHEACQRIHADAMELSSGDPVMTRFVEAVASGLHDVNDISRATGLTAKDIYRAKGKLQKRRRRRSP
jgi:hypothetical protein